MTELERTEAPRVELLLRGYAQAKARYEDELGTRRLVYPDGRDFPDPFQGDFETTHRLLTRMQSYAGMKDIPVELEFVRADGQAQSSCSSGACSVPSIPSPNNMSRVVDQGDGWLIRISEQETAHSVFLTTELARALALVFVLETSEPGDAAPSPFLLEVVAVLLGFGGILLQGSYVYQKACSGPRVSQLTTLSVAELGFLAALMARDSGSELGRLRGLLEATQRAALGDAEVLLDEYASFVAALRKNPTRAAELGPRREEPKGLWGRVKSRLGAREPEPLPEGDLDLWQKALEGAAKAEPRAPRALPSQELRDLVKSEL